MSHMTFRPVKEFIVVGSVVSWLSSRLAVEGRFKGELLTIMMLLVLLLLTFSCFLTLC